MFFSSSPLVVMRGGEGRGEGRRGEERGGEERRGGEEGKPIMQL